MHKLLIIPCVFMCLSAAQQAAVLHVATYSVAIDGVSLVVKFPTRNELGKAIPVSMEFRNDTDKVVSYWGQPPELGSAFPFDVDARDSSGKPIFGVAPGPDAPYGGVEPHTSIKKQVDLGPHCRTPGRYLLSVMRGFNEDTKNDWGNLEIHDAAFYVGKIDNPNFTDN